MTFKKKLIFKRKYIHPKSTKNKVHLLSFSTNTFLYDCTYKKKKKDIYMTAPK